jgi:hypothetical protein
VPLFVGLDFPREQDKQTTIKFNINSKVLFTYRLIPRTSGFREQTVFFGTIPVSRFLGAPYALTTAYNIKMLIFGYQSVDMHCIAISVKFDGKLFLSVLRNKQLFTKRGSKVYIFKKGSHFSKTLFWISFLM